MMEYSHGGKGVHVIDGPLPIAMSRGTGGRRVALRRGVEGAWHRKAVACKHVSPAIAGDRNAAWVHLVMEGTWKGHPEGDTVFDAKAFSQILANFEAVKTPIPFKYEHPTQNGGEPIPSAGKVHDLRLNESGLWAFVKFTDRAAEMIRAEEYEYCSVVVMFESIDRKTGEDCGAELLEVGLTDNPFIDGQEKIALAA